MIPERKNRLQINLARLRTARRSPHRESGAILVESALTTLLLVAMLIGAMQISLALYSYHFVAHAAHEATRYAIVRGSDWTNSSGVANACDGTGNTGSGYNSVMCEASVADVQNFVANMNFPGINITPGDVCVEYFSSIPSSASSSCTNSTGTLADGLGDVVQVTITYPYSFGIPGLGAYNYTLASTSQMVIAQ